MAIITDPKDIQIKSFRIVDSYLKDLKLPRAQKEVVKRVIHATSELNYAGDILFHPAALRNGLKALRDGKNIVADATMVKAGINKKLLSIFGSKAICLLNRKDVARQASRLNVTRSMVAMRKAHALMEGGIVAIGNAPTALFELCDLVNAGKAKPSLIIGMPVGFVGAKESKNKLRTLNIPYITNRTRRGGSSATAACVNALLKIAERKKMGGLCNAYLRRNTAS